MIPPRLFGRVYSPQVKPNHARLSAMLSPSLPDPPAAYDVDANLPRGNVPTAEMDGNNFHSDCVLAAQGKILRRFLAEEYGTLITVTQPEIEYAYFRQSGGADDGLIVEDSLQSWITIGWIGGGELRKIAAFARVHADNRRYVQLAISLMSGLIIGVQLPQAWMDANDRGDVWDVPPSGAEIIGGHATWVSAYDADGVTVETWGKKQLLTWAAFEWAASERNQGEALAIVRQNDSGVVPLDGIDLVQLTSDLAAIREAS